MRLKCNTCETIFESNQHASFCIRCGSSDIDFEKDDGTKAGPLDGISNAATVKYDTIFHKDTEYYK